MNRTRTALLTTAFALVLPAALLAQGSGTAPTAPKQESQAQLQKEAKVTLKAATAAAMGAVKGGKVATHELEREKGKLIYSFDMKVAGKTGIDEVAVDAMTGAVLEVTHESPADEAKEAAADRKAAGRKPAATTPPVKKP